MFSKQRLFQAAWKELYPDILEWVSLSAGGKVTSVDPGTNTLSSPILISIKRTWPMSFRRKEREAIAERAGVTDASGWCPIDPVTFGSKLQADIHVIGDAAIAGAMPKSAFAANAQAKICALAVAKLLRGETPVSPKLINTCYSLVAPDYGISTAGVYDVANGQLAEVPGSGGLSPADAPRSTRSAEAILANDWFRTVTTEVFG